MPALPHRAEPGPDMPRRACQTTMCLTVPNRDLPCLPNRAQPCQTMTCLACLDLPHPASPSPAEPALICPAQPSLAVPGPDVPCLPKPPPVNYRQRLNHLNQTSTAVRFASTSSMPRITTSSSDNPS